MGIVVIGAVFVDVKGFPEDKYIPQGRNVGRIEQVHGGVSRNVAEDIANVELRPTYVSLVDDNSTGADVLHKLRSHKVNTDYIRTVHGGMGTWLAVFDHTGDVVGSISQRPNMLPLLDILEEHGDEIFRNADSIIIEICLQACKAIQQAYLHCGCKYVHCCPAAGLFAGYRLLHLQPAGGRDPLFRRLFSDWHRAA